MLAREKQAQCVLVREVFGPVPFRTVRLKPEWQSAPVVALASRIYADRTFDRMPDLASALRDAGCDDTDILAHSRDPGPHVLGCWVLDMVLGKE
ncbi:hypothetical protein J0H58_18670 [bacterium]|nr:hypothetical protein [bacterium]